MNKRKLGYFISGIVLGAWTIFCLCEVGELQERQCLKVQEQERKALLEMNRQDYVGSAIETTVVTTTVATTTVEVESTTEVETTQTETETIVSPKKEDVMLLARLIEAEGGVESYQCKLYIGSVVLNRVYSKSFPDTIRDVIFQVNKNGVHQFSVTKVRKDGTRAIDCEPSEDSLKAAEYLLTYGTQLPLDVLVFYADCCKEGWVTTRAKYTKVDTTVFAYMHKAE